MKYLILVLDRISDVPLAELEGKTPLETASHPSLDFLAQNGTAGTVRNIPFDFETDSDAAMLSVFGYDPAVYYSGSGPFEAVSLEIPFDKESDVVYRCDFVTVKNKIMEDCCAGNIPTDESRILIKMLDTKLGSDKIKFLPGKDYRNIFLSRRTLFEINGISPCEIIGKDINDYLPAGKGKKTVSQILSDANLLLEGHEVNRNRRLEGKKTANTIWIYSGGVLPRLPALKEKFQLDGSLISSDDFVKGIGICMGLEIVKIPLAEDLSANYKKIVEHAAKVLKKKDFCAVHISDISSSLYNGDAQLKVKMIENIDREIIAPLLEAVKGMGEYKIMVATDYISDIKTKKTSKEAVPFVIYSPLLTPNGTACYTESQISKSPLQFSNGHELFSKFIARD